MSTLQSSFTPQDPALLEELGKSAARLSESSGLSLTEAVVRTVGHQKLSAQHVRRVVEACNVEAVNQKYASLSGPNRIVNIDGGPADPVQVMQELKIAAGPQSTQIEALEYSLPPQRTKQAAVADFVPVHGESQHEIRYKLAAAHDELSQKAEASSFLMETALESLKVAAESAAGQGASLREMYAAWARTGYEPFAKIAVAQFRDQIPWGSGAQRSLNPEAPVVVRFQEFAKIAERCAIEQRARKSIELELARIPG